MTDNNLAGEAYAAYVAGEVDDAGEAYAPDMTDSAERATWTADGLRALIDRLRVMYGDEAVDRAYYARIESDGTQGDTAKRVVDCGVCEGPSTVMGTGKTGLDSREYLHLDCGHLVPVGGAA